MRKVLLPLKGTIHDFEAGDVAGLLSRELNAQAVVFSAKRQGAPQTEEQLRIIAKIKSRLEDTFALEVKFIQIETANPGDAILAEAKKGYDYLVIGATVEDRSSPLGKTGSYVFDNSPIPVVIAKYVKQAGGK